MWRICPPPAVKALSNAISRRSPHSLRGMMTQACRRPLARARWATMRASSSGGNPNWTSPARVKSARFKASIGRLAGTARTTASTAGLSSGPMSEWAPAASA